MSDVVFEDSGHVFLQALMSMKRPAGQFNEGSAHLGEYTLGVADQQTRLPAPPIAHDDKLLAVLRRRGDVCARAGAGGGVDCAIGGAGGATVAAIAAVEEGSRAVLAPEVVVVLHGLHGHGWREGKGQGCVECRGKVCFSSGFFSYLMNKFCVVGMLFGELMCCKPTSGADGGDGQHSAVDRATPNFNRSHVRFTCLVPQALLPSHVFQQSLFYAQN